LPAEVLGSPNLPGGKTGMESLGVQGSTAHKRKPGCLGCCRESRRGNGRGRVLLRKTKGEDFGL